MAIKLTVSGFWWVFGFRSCEGWSVGEHLFAARLQSFVRSSQKDFRLSSAAFGRLNIYLAFIGGEILAEAQKRRRTFLSCISAPERGVVIITMLSLCIRVARTQAMGLWAWGIDKERKQGKEDFSDWSFFLEQEYLYNLLFSGKVADACQYKLLLKSRPCFLN